MNEMKNGKMQEGTHDYDFYAIASIRLSFAISLQCIIVCFIWFTFINELIRYTCTMHTRRER